MALNINIHTPMGLVPISSGSSSSSDVTYQQIIDILGYTPLDVNNYVNYTFTSTTKYVDVSSEIVNNNSNVSVNLKTQTLEDAIFTGNDTGLATAYNVATELANTELAIAQSINNIKDSVGLKNNLTINWEGRFDENTSIVDAIKNIKGNSNTTDILATGVYETSDIRKKNIIAKDISVNRCYDVIEKCSTILYTLKDDTSNKQQIGLIAQEIEEFFPEIIQTDQDGYKSIDYGRLVVICMRVLKDMIDWKNNLNS